MQKFGLNILYIEKRLINCLKSKIVLKAERPCLTKGYNDKSNKKLIEISCCMSKSLQRDLKYQMLHIE